MICKLFEIRDRGTCITALAIKPKLPASADADPERYAQYRYHLGRTGFTWQDGEPATAVLLGDMNGRKVFNVDPYDWQDRTWHVAHQHIEKHFDTLPDGAVIDVRFILGEVSEPAAPDRGFRP